MALTYWLFFYYCGYRLNCKYTLCTLRIKPHLFLIICISSDLSGLLRVSRSISILLTSRKYSYCPLQKLILFYPKSVLVLISNNKYLLVFVYDFKTLPLDVRISVRSELGLIVSNNKMHISFLYVFEY